MVSLGIVGFGGLASSVYAPALQQMTPRARLSGIAEIDPCRRQLAESRLRQVPVFNSLAELLSEQPVNAVLIAAPPTTHAELATEAFAAGLSVYLEKPLAANADDARRIVEAWRRAGTVGMIGFAYRYNTIIRQLSRALEAEELGPVISAQTSFGLLADELPAWKSRRSSGGGALLDLGVHHVDLLLHLLASPVRRVSCEIWSDRSEEDNATLTLTFDSGVVTQSRLSLSTVEEDRIEIRGRRGTLTYDRYGSERLLRTGRAAGPIRRQLLTNRVLSLIPGPDLAEKLRAPWREPAFPRALAAFVDAVTSGCDLHPDIDDGWRSLEVILAAEEAHRTGAVQEMSP